MGHGRYYGKCYSECHLKYYVECYGGCSCECFGNCYDACYGECNIECYDECRCVFRYEWYGHVCLTALQCFLYPLFAG